MNIKPIQIAVFLILVLGVLFGLTFLSQEEAIKKKHKAEDGFALTGLQIKYPTTENFLQLEEDSVATLEQIKTVTTSVIPIEEEVPEETLVNVDSIISEPEVKLVPQKIDFSKIDTTQIVRIRYPDSMPDFISDLRKKLNSKQCRILHYGDSQLEGDRITSYLRNRLQGLYGGSGPGFIPIKQVYRQISAEVVPSDNWERYALFDPTQAKFSHKKYGTYMSISRFTPAVETLPDSLALDTMAIQKATITIGKTKKSYARLRKFNTIGLHYGNCLDAIKVKVYNNDQLIQRDSLIADANYHNYKIKLPSTPTNLRIELEGKISADFYGLTLDSGKGVQIDNVAMRGASGTVFAKSSATNYSRMTRTLKPKVVIMQYGGNTVPYLKDSTQVENYSKYIIHQINWIKRRTKGVQVIFIGPTDMSTSVNGNMETYKILPYLNQTLMETCLKNEVAYWSMYDAMGGKGSMKLWVDEKLAGSDYTHFTPKGTKIISELFFTALYLDLKSENDEAL
ncbi:SGNH/GDSL hydrolase family protein [Aquimarina rhabdastrellae]